jgi:hypothetical protein
MQQAKDNSKQLSNLSVNTAKTFEQNSKELTAAIQDARSNNSNVNTGINTNTGSGFSTQSDNNRGN